MAAVSRGFVRWLAQRAGLLVIVIVALAVLLALSGCGPKPDDSSPCKGWESLPGATCSPS